MVCLGREKMMPTKYPLEYELHPQNVSAGMRWLTLRIKNASSEELTSLDIKLNSMDTYGVGVYGTGNYLPILEPGEEEAIPFQISATHTTRLYVSVDGRRDGTSLYWESPAIRVVVGREIAELVSLFALTEPYPEPGERIRCEATVRSIEHSEGLHLELWADTPGEEFLKLAQMETQALDAGEEAQYAAEFDVDQEGVYTIYAYLYDRARRIGREIDHVQVRSPAPEPGAVS